MSEAEVVKFEVEDGVGVITVNNPPVNALGPGVREGIIEGVEKGLADDSVKAMVSDPAANARLRSGWFVRIAVIPLELKKRSELDLGHLDGIVDPLVGVVRHRPGLDLDHDGEHLLGEGLRVAPGIARRHDRVAVVDLAGGPLVVGPEIVDLAQIAGRVEERHHGGVADQRQVAKPEELIALSVDLGVRLIPCQMTMDLLGLKRSDLIDGLEEPIGAATAIAHMRDAAVSLFI